MIDLQPTLENDLVLIRPLLVEDFENLYKVAKDAKIWELHQNPNRYELQVFRQFFKDAINSKGALVIIDKATSKIIGSSRFKQTENSNQAVEIGWTFLSRSYWGGVYNKSFKGLMITHAFEYFDYVLFHVDENNFRSQKAVKKLGGTLIDRQGTLAYLHTPKKSGLTFILGKKEVT
ncbi:GNAT family N-acetyltransferase [Croceitalea rosinachiae]|uniref:GNAT family N-acetyltransferase n=1 Tax=Croceitalea rosinachiae TaxID=3075596 RepID=A0ABU3AAD5_9FLAO|nr:GNAT family N-acetyltransferase [Croceitalea sp. F388]MDT0607147.1 GNAT family N-acetyltransferase [Croceitalea sp. F388]